VDRAKAKAYFEQLQGAAISVFKVNNLLDGFLRKFLLEGGFDVE
jgi:type I restriction enzyme R subunit